MTDLAIDPVTRDLIVKNGRVTAIQNEYECAQSVGIRLRTFVGEWFLDVTHGVPYIEQIFGKVSRPEIIEAILRAQILSVKNVASLETFTMNIDPYSRHLSVKFSGRTTAGEVFSEATTIRAKRDNLALVKRSNDGRAPLGKFQLGGNRLA